MPYLDQPFVVGGTVLDEAGIWVPERNWDRWHQRERAMPYPAWRRDADPPLSLPPLTTEAASVLARDIGDAQRDALVYANLLERLKNSPSDDNDTAGQVVDQMVALGFASASWPPGVGGPPPTESSRPWRAVLAWLLRLAGKVGRFLLRCIDFVRATFAAGGITAISVGISWPPSVSFSIPTAPGPVPDPWEQARSFLDVLITELSTWDP